MVICIQPQLATECDQRKMRYTAYWAIGEIITPAEILTGAEKSGRRLQNSVKESRNVVLYIVRGLILKLP